MYFTGSLLFILGMAIIALLISLRRVSGKIYVGETVINKSYDTVWKWISDPMNYSRLHRKGVSEIKPAGENKYRAVSPHIAEPYEIELGKDKNAGMVDLRITLPDGNVESSRLRVIEYDPEKTILLRIVKRWKSMGHLKWLVHTYSVDSDFRTTKKIIEAE